MKPQLAFHGSVLPPSLDGRLNYSITGAVLGNFSPKSEARSPHYLRGLALTRCGFLSAERTTIHGVHHNLLLELTEAEIIALYMAVGIKRNGIRYTGKLRMASAPECITDFAHMGYDYCPGPLRRIADGSRLEGFDTTRGGLAQRVRQVLAVSPQAGMDFMATARSTTIVDDSSIPQIMGRGFESLITELTGLFAWKYEKEMRILTATS